AAGAGVLSAASAARARRRRERGATPALERQAVRLRSVPSGRRLDPAQRAPARRKGLRRAQRYAEPRRDAVERRASLHPRRPLARPAAEVTSHAARQLGYE